MTKCNFVLQELSLLISVLTLEAKDHKTTTEFCLKEFGKLNILMHIEIRYLFLKILQFYVFKMAANGGCHFKIIIKITKLNLFLKNMHTHTLLTTTIFAYYVNNHFMWLF